MVPVAPIEEGNQRSGVDENRSQRP
jgi:hypothetical protein